MWAPTSRVRLKDGVQVHLQHLGEVGVGEGGAGVTALDARALDQDADLMAVGEDLGREGRHRGGRGEVGCVDECFAA